MFRVFLAGWLIAVLEMGCGGRSSRDQRQPAEGGKAGSANAGSSPATPHGGVASVADTGSASGAAATAGQLDNGEAGAGEAGAAGAPNCSCVNAELGWWRAGGIFGTDSQSFVASCRMYTFTSGGEVGVSPPTTSCSSMLDGCGARLGVDDLNSALAQPGIQAALAAAPVLYGRDPRPLDGHVAHIEVDGKVIEVGYSCDNDPSCQVPADVDRFRRLLDDLQKAEEGASCALE